MKRILLLTAVAAVAAACATNTPLEIREDGYTLTLTAIDDNAIRVRAVPDTPVNDLQLEELVYTEQVKRPRARISSNGSENILSTANITATYDKVTHSLTFLDSDGNVLLQEARDGRRLSPSTTQGVPSLDVRQEFMSPRDEYLYGTGQFQDGYLNIRGLTRRTAS